MSHTPINQRHSPVGWVPSDWGLKKLSSLADISYGISDPLNKTLKQGIPIIGMPNVTKYGRFKWDIRFFISPNNVKEKNLLRMHDILFNWRNGSKDHLGKTVLYKLIGKHTHVGFLLRIRCNDALDPTYCDLYIKGIKDRGYFLKAKMQVNNTFNKEELSSLPVVLPPLPEQQKIAQILSTWDKAIEKLESLIATKKKRKKALMQRLLTGKKRFAGFEGEWEEVSMGNVFKRITRKNTEVNTNVVTISAQKGLIKQDEFFNKSVSSETLDNYFLLKKGEFAYNKSYSNGYPMGAIKRLNNYDKAVVTTLYICFEIKDLNFSCSSFFEHYFESGRLVHGLMKVANEGGRAHGLLNVTPKDFFELKLLIPKFSEQQKIAAVLSAADKEIEIHQKELSALKQQKKGLMQQLLTGKKRIKIDEPEQMAAVGA